MSEQNDAPAISPAPEVAPVQFVNPAARWKAVDLDYPVEYGGKVFASIIVRRLTVTEVAEFADAMKALRAADPDKSAPWPMYFDLDGERVPDAVLGHLDDDDSAEIEKVTADFLPRRFRGNPTE